MQDPTAQWVLIKRGTENGMKQEMKQNDEAKQLLQLLTKEYDLKQSNTFILNKYLNQQSHISIFGPH